MRLGPAVRTRLGRWEVPAANLFRSPFINLDDLVATVASLGPAKRILEIGCGDGTHATRVCAAFPDGEYLGIDIAAEPGRLFRGDERRATFRTVSSAELLAEHPEPFDLVLFVDVVHHIPRPQRLGVLRDAAALTAPTGTIIIKEWERLPGLAHMLCYVADRYVTGDEQVDFATKEELDRLLAEALDDFEVTLVSRVPPRRNNLLYALRRV
jgi:2-polyprenyl-6-hydroxyphenyl methylase/3-demethylubiquinone-9 3-methyltransferase